MPDPIDLGKLTDAETAELAVRCLDTLTLADKVQTVLKAFHSAEERAELSEWLESEGEEEEESED